MLNALRALIPFNLYINQMRQALLLDLFVRCGNNVTKVMKLAPNHIASERRNPSLSDPRDPAFHHFWILLPKLKKQQTFLD